MFVSSDLAGAMGVAPSISGHEHTNLNRVCCFILFSVFLASKGFIFSEIASDILNHENVPIQIQQNFNGSNTFRTMKISSQQG